MNEQNKIPNEYKIIRFSFGNWFLPDFLQAQTVQIYSENGFQEQSNKLEVEKNYRVAQQQIDRFHPLYQKQMQNWVRGDSDEPAIDSKTRDAVEYVAYL